MEPPEKLLADLSMNGWQWLCRELRIDLRPAVGLIHIRHAHALDYL